MRTPLAACLPTPLSLRTLLALQSQVAPWVAAPSHRGLAPLARVFADVGRAGPAFRRAQRELASVGLAVRAVHVHLSRTCEPLPAWRVEAHDALLVQLFGSSRWRLPTDAVPAAIAGGRPAAGDVSLCVGSALVIGAGTPRSHSTLPRVTSVFVSFDLGRTVSERMGVEEGARRP